MSSLKEIEFVAMLTPEDRYRHRHIRFRRDILSFVVQYETKLEGKWLPVVRYDKNMVLLIVIYLTGMEIRRRHQCLRKSKMKP